MTPNFRRHRGFTLVELLLVVTIIAIVLALVFVAIRQLQNQARATACLSNQRQLALANSTYASDNGGRTISPRTDAYPPVNGMRGTTNCWVNTIGATVGNSVEQVKSLEQGALWSYMNEDPKGYQSPMDPTGRVRSYSFSSFIGVGGRDFFRRADDYYNFPDPESPEMPEGSRNVQFRSDTLSSIPQPSRTLATITEEDGLFQQNGVAGYNFQGFAIEIRPPTGAGGLWIDTPALWNIGRVNISYMDGSVDAPNIIYEQLEKIMQPNSSLPPLHEVTETGSRPAFRFMASILMPGVIRPEIQ
jgi:prepilin-type N-terminal cleavage/methylation domain-containing protein